MDEYPVKVGAMLFTMVDPNRGHEVAYNRWYERDHFYAGVMTGPYAFAGGRWVAPRELKDLRWPSDSPFARPVDSGSYLSIYWYLAGNEDEHIEWGGQQVRWLYGNGRGFAERTHAHTGIYDFRSAWYADEDGVPIELALDHRYPGLSVVVLEPRGETTTESLCEWTQAGPARALLSESAVEIVSSWTLRPGTQAGGSRGPSSDRVSPMPLGTDGGSPDRLVQLLFSSDPPTESWDQISAYGRAVDESGRAVVTFAAPFLPTVVGTDVYTDRLW